MLYQISLKSIFDLNVFFLTQSCSIYILNSMDQTQPNSRADPQLNPGSGRGLLFENLHLLGVYYMDLLCSCSRFTLGLLFMHWSVKQICLFSYCLKAPPIVYSKCRCLNIWSFFTNDRLVCTVMHLFYWWNGGFKWNYSNFPIHVLTRPNLTAEPTRTNYPRSAFVAWSRSDWTVLS